MKLLEEINEPLEFEWDEGNTNKNWHKHTVSQIEMEQAFFDEKKLLSNDLLHSHSETRYILLGKTEEGRVLFISFTIRKRKIRVISARDLNKKKEGYLYEKEA